MIIIMCGIASNLSLLLLILEFNGSHHLPLCIVRSLRDKVTAQVFENQCKSFAFVLCKLRHSLWETESVKCQGITRYVDVWRAVSGYNLWTESKI